MYKVIACLICLLLLAESQIVAQQSNASSSVDEKGLTAQRGQDPLVINPLTINQLAALDARQTPGIAQFGPQGNLNAKKFWLLRLTSDKKLAWTISVPEAGEYYVDFLINSKPASHLKVTSALNTVAFSPVEKGWQRSQSSERLKLPAGQSVVRFQVDYPADTIEIKAIELINVAQKGAIDKRVQAFKGDVSWMKEAGYGIMTQVGGWAYPPKGPKKQWPGFAEDFDVKAFVDKVQDMGGKYIVWSATWADFLFPAPIKAIAEILPDRVSKRDLIGELINECQKRNIRVMLYYHLGHDQKEVLLAKGWKDAPVEEYSNRQKWLDREMKIFTEMGNRYGKGLDGIFLDDGVVWYPADFEKLGAALKAGNPKRVICYNPWISPNLTPFQDFYCGEGFDGSKTPYKIADGIIQNGPQKGLQLFGNFIFDGPDWGNNKPNMTIDPPKNWTVEKLVAMTKRLEAERYSVALNLLVYEDGSMGPESYTMLKEVAKQLKRGKWAK